MDEDKLYVSDIQINDALRIKRYRPRAKGSAASIIKRTSTIVVKVKERN
jgi:large subunit ribosomal protein L22